jgi:hypothetical protein
VADDRGADDRVADDATVRVRPVAEDEGGDPACWLNRVCPECGRLSEDARSTRCSSCGAELPGD